jgi:serine/threonine-protein kinase
MIGEVVNNYRVVSLLGEGGMGSVYLAEHPVIGRKAAIKVLRRELVEDASLVERFVNEARAANAIRHPNIIEIIDVGRLPSGVPYLMMEFLEGTSLAACIGRSERLPVNRAVDILAQAASALSAAHAKAIVHRDLKPDNIFLCPDESARGGERVKVLDFGIAKLRGELGGNSAKTQTGSLMGTPPYMSPEQCRGVSDDIDHRTDIYALGIILYEMLCGAPPFVSPGWGDIVLAHLTQAPAPPRSKNPEVPEALEELILKALAKKADDRFASAAEMRAALLPFSSSTTLEPRAVPGVFAGATRMLPQTTFRANSGEVITAPLPTSTRPRRTLLVGVAVVAAGAVAAVGVSKRKHPDMTPAAPAVAAVPISRPQPPPSPVVAPPPPAHPKAAPIREVLVRLDSEPAGALVIDASTGEQLGSTPFERRVAATRSTLDLRLAKAGFKPAAISLPLDIDVERSIRLERRGARPAVAPPATSAPAVAPPVASPPTPAAPIPAAPRPRSPQPVEKW